MKSSVTMIGISAAIRAVEEEIEHAARSDAKVLITGESGVGKEIVARLIHERSNRRSAPLVTINCAGFPDSLLESELFGHVKGSFTDAHRDKRGWLESADGGTIFMDEIGEMSLRMQALLLRFLETGEIQRVGSDRRLPPLDVRVIAATHRRLIDHIADKTFREDLYYRLNVIHIEVPPLRERREDIFVLLNHFFRGFSESHQLPVPEVSAEALVYLTAVSVAGQRARAAQRRRTAGVALRQSARRRRRAAAGDSARSEQRRRRRRRRARGGRRCVPMHQVLFERLITQGASFWSEVYEPFMARDLTRHEIRELVRLGLEHTRGNYKLLVTSFNMPPEDYKKFLNFLRKYQCHVPFQRFRMVPAGLPARSKFSASA